MLTPSAFANSVWVTGTPDTLPLCRARARAARGELTAPPESATDCRIGSRYVGTSRAGVRI